MTNTWELIELADKMGLTGAEFRVWYEERMEREREQRAAERKAAKEKLELVLRAKKEELERVTRENKVLLERQTRILKQQLQLERVDFERRLELAMAKRGQLAMPKVEQAVNVCSDSSVCWREVDSCKVGLEPRDSLTSEREAQIEEGREVDSQEGRSHEELVEATESFSGWEHITSVSCLGTSERPSTYEEERLDMGDLEAVKNVVEQSFDSREQRSSIQNEVCIRTSQRPSTFQEEVGLPLNSSMEGALERHWDDGSECHEGSDIVATDCFVPTEVAAGTMSMVLDHTYISLRERGDSSSQDSVTAICPRKHDGSAEALFKINSIESEVGSIVGMENARQGLEPENVIGFEPIIKSTQDERYNDRAQGHSFSRIQEPHTLVGAFGLAEGTPSLCSLDGELKESICVRDCGIWTFVSQCVSCRRRRLETAPCSSVTGKRSCGRRGRRHAFQRTCIKACLPQLLSKRARRAVRLVWDAIT